MDRINNTISYSGIKTSVIYDHKTSLQNCFISFHHTRNESSTINYLSVNSAILPDNNRIIPAIVICEYSGYFHMYPYIVKNHDIFTYGNCEKSGNLHKSGSGYRVEFHTLKECFLRFLRYAFCDQKLSFCDHTSDYRVFSSALLLP